MGPDNVGEEEDGLSDGFAEGSKRLTEMRATELGSAIEAVGDGGMMLALTPVEGEVLDLVETSTGVVEGTRGGKSSGGVEVSEQMVVVTLTTVVDVWTTVAPAGQLTASDAHSVTVYVDVAITTVVTMSLRARSTSREALAMLMP